MSSPTEICYSVVKVNKSHGSRKVLEGITLGFYKGAKIGVIGGNGSGKSTLLRILALKEEPSSGQVLPQKGGRYRPDDEREAKLDIVTGEGGVGQRLAVSDSGFEPSVTS